MQRLFFLCLLLMLVGLANSQSLTTATFDIFSGSGNCATCHQPGSPNTSALLDAHGHDVSPVTLWRSTMMANAARDPFWQAKVSAEVAANPHLQSVIEDKCTTCHAPLGRTEAIYDGASAYTIEQMRNDPLAMDGVSCTACHQIKADNLGQVSSFSGHYIIENDRIIYGPFKNPLTNPMQNMVNYTPQFGEQTHQSELCATCHTLFTPYVDDNGNVVGEAPEQTPYLEWKNSVFPAQNVQCQTCHMPVLEESVVISNRPNSLTARAEFARHYFVGGNVYMLRLLKANAEALGVTATQAHFDSTIARTLRMLQKETAEISAKTQWLTEDTLQIKITVKNKAGHKFPTAYPSRRAWLQVRLSNAQANVLFESGGWDETQNDIRDLDIPFEKHHDLITQPQQVQVYQSVMKDVNNEVNYTLLRAAGYLKDNRIPPEGFTNNGPAYDSTAIIGQAEEDVNFNEDASGSDVVTYKIGGLTKSAQYQLLVKLNYQSLSPRFVNDLLKYDTPEVQTFKTYYEKLPNLPVVIDSLQLTVTSTSIGTDAPFVPEKSLLVSAFPNPFNPQVNLKVQIPKAGRLTIDIFNINGKKVKALVSMSVKKGVYQLLWNGSNDEQQLLPSGAYLVSFTWQDQNSKLRLVKMRKIILLR